MGPLRDNECGARSHLSTDSLKLRIIVHPTREVESGRRSQRQLEITITRVDQKPLISTGRFQEVYAFRRVK